MVYATPPLGKRPACREMLAAERVRGSGGPGGRSPAKRKGAILISAAIPLLYPATTWGAYRDLWNMTGERAGRAAVHVSPWIGYKPRIRGGLRHPSAEASALAADLLDRYF